jgi:hypothetical protein
VIELIWIGALMIGSLIGALVAGVRWLLGYRHGPTALIAAVSERLDDHLRAQGLATEADAIAWGFPADWMAAERIELFWASKREQA